MGGPDYQCPTSYVFTPPWAGAWSLFIHRFLTYSRLVLKVQTTYLWPPRFFTRKNQNQTGPESLSRLRGPTGLHSAQALRASGTGNHKHPQENLLPQKAPSSLCVLRTTYYGPHASRPFHGTARKYHPQQLFSELYVAEPGRPQKPLQLRNVCRQSQLGTAGGLWVEVPRT